MLGKVCGLSSVYPCIPDEELRQFAAGFENATLCGDGVTYHIDRYDEAGLFGLFDPAEQTIGTNGLSMKQQFPGLQSVRNALVVAARVPKGGS